MSVPDRQELRGVEQGIIVERHMVAREPLPRNAARPRVELYYRQWDKHINTIARIWLAT